MSKIDFGELDYFCKVPANDLKEKLQQIAFCHIQNMLTDFAFDEKGALAFMSEVDGMVGLVEAIGETIDEEVDYYNSKMEQLKAKAGDNDDAT